MKVLNIGSGKTKIEHAINIDIRDDVGADYVMNITDRQTALSVLGKESFDKIIAHDVLEHIPNLVAAMEVCRDLLKEGGRMDIIVPYDLSYGAWQDPTHYRAFNERSWWYYDQWCWYLGWKEFKLEAEKIEFLIFDPKIAEYAKEVGLEKVKNEPRVVDAMHVVLKKVRI